MALNAKRDGLTFLLLGAITFLALSLVLQRTSQSTSVDFAIVYFPTRCFLHRCDPYDARQVMKEFSDEGGPQRWALPLKQQIITTLPYPPSVFPILFPFAILPWTTANAIWFLLTAAGLVLATLLTWKLVSDEEPLLAGILTGFMIANCMSVLILGNPAGLATSLCVVAMCCFLARKWTRVGVVCLVLSLALKPHDSAFLWMYLFLAGGAMRKSALQTVAVFAALIGPVVLWVTVRVPGWLGELISNLKSFAVRGGVTDPGPASIGNHGLGSMVNLQSAFAFAWDDAAHYKLASYAVSGMLSILLLWAMRGRISGARNRMLVAAFSTFTLLPIYHHLYDAKILLLLIPACVELWRNSNKLRWPAVILTAASLVITGDWFWTVLLIVAARIPAAPNSALAQAVAGAQMVPVPLILLTTCVFFAWAARHPDVLQQAEANA